MEEMKPMYKEKNIQFTKIYSLKEFELTEEQEIRELAKQHAKE